MQRFTKEELARYNGQDENPAFIAFEGKIYDVSGSFLWRNGKHQVMHFAGKDLTEDIAQAPHGPDLLEKYQVVGILVDD